MKKILIFLGLTMFIYTNVIRGQAITISPTNVSCYGVCDGSAKVSVLGPPPPYIYYWSNGTSGPTFDKINNLCPGTYTVTVRDNGLWNETASLTITEPPKLVVITSTTPDTINTSKIDGAVTANVTGGDQGHSYDSGYSYNWGWGFSITKTITGLSCGTYSVTVSDANGCTASSTAVVTCVTGMNELNYENGFSIYPNPSTTTLTIEVITGKPHIIQLMTLLGEIIYSTQEFAYNRIIIDVGVLPKGVYMVQLIEKNGNTGNKQRLVIK